MEQNKAEIGKSEGRNYFRESVQELRAKDEPFTKQINFVFATLQTIESRAPNGRARLTI